MPYYVYVFLLPLCCHNLVNAVTNLFDQVGDPQESGALYNVFCKGRKGCLYVGSVKSNCGHAESKYEYIFYKENILK